MTDFEIFPIFATPLYTTQVTEMTQEERHYIMNTDYDKGELHSLSSDKHILDRTPLLNLKNVLTEKVNFFTTQLLGIQTKDENNDFEFFIKNSWSLRIKRGHPYSTHFHTRSIISGVLYINVDENCGSINFKREYPNYIFTHYGFSVKNWNIYNSNNYCVNPTIGKLLLFPSTIQHYMGDFNSDITRYSLAFDVYIKGVMGKNTPALNFYFKDNK